jgi:hypothetical protein
MSEEARVLHARHAKGYGGHAGGVQDVANPPANTPAVITYPAQANRTQCVRGVVFAFDDDPTTTPRLQIATAGAVIFSNYVTTGGMGPLSHLYKRGRRSQNLVITLEAGGAGVSGSLSIENHWTE